MNLGLRLQMLEKLYVLMDWQPVWSLLEQRFSQPISSQSGDTEQTPKAPHTPPGLRSACTFQSKEVRLPETIEAVPPFPLSSSTAPGGAWKPVLVPVENSRCEKVDEYAQKGDNKEEQQDNDRDNKQNKFHTADMNDKNDKVQADREYVGEKNDKSDINDKGNKEDKNMQYNVNEGDAPKELADGTGADSNLAAEGLAPDNQALLDALRTLFEDRLGVG